MELKVLVTITVIVAVYMIVGGIIFQKIESADLNDLSETEMLIHLPIAEIDSSKTIMSLDEIKRLLEKTIERIRSAHVAATWELEVAIVDMDTARSSGQLDDEMQLFFESPSTASNKTGDEFEHKATSVLQTVFRAKRYHHWSLYDAIFYAQTIVTTIGYGAHAPITPHGRGFSCVYAIFGIPLIGIWMAGVGELIFGQVEKLRKKRHIEKRLRTWFLFAHFLAIVTAGSAIFIFLPSVLFSVIEGWTYTDAVYYAVMSLTTIGLGDLVAGLREDSPHWYRILLNLWLLLGLGWLSMLISLIMGMIRSRATKVINKASEKVVYHMKRRVSVAGHRLPRTVSFAGVREISVFLSQNDRTRSCSSPPAYGSTVKRSRSMRDDRKCVTPTALILRQRTSSLPFMTVDVVDERRHDLSTTPPTHDVTIDEKASLKRDLAAAANQVTPIMSSDERRRSRKIKFFISSHKSARVAPMPEHDTTTFSAPMMTPIRAHHPGFQTPILVYDKKLTVPDRRLSHVTSQGIIERVDPSSHVVIVEAHGPHHHKHQHRQHQPEIKDARKKKEPKMTGCLF